jgi:uncharacterized membrane protein
MQDDLRPVSSTPEWEYLIAHHFPDRYSRTLELRRGSRAYHFCARCTGELLGFVGCLALFLAIPWFATVGSTAVAAAILGLCPAAALVDWLTQTTRSRESTNPVRVGSGALLGIAFAGLVAFAVTGNWILFGVGLAVVGSYLIIALVVLYTTDSWRRVLDEHFP